MTPSAASRARTALALGVATLVGVPATAAALGTSGGLDPTFNGGAPLELDLSKSAPRNTGFDELLADGAGRLVLGGTTTDSSGKTSAVIGRLGAAGALDGSFGDGGTRIFQVGASAGTPYTPYSSPAGLFPLPGGGIGFGAYASRPDGRFGQSAMALTEAGNPNFDIGSAGFMTRDPQPAPGYANTSAATAGPDGSVYVSGVVEANPSSGANRKLAITKFTPAGVAAAGFGSGGTLVTSFSESTSDAGTYGGPVHVLPGNRLLMAGTTSSSDGRQATLLARFNTLTGAADPTFGTKNGGTVIQARDAGGSDSQGSALAVGPDNAIYLGGFADDSQGRSAMLVIRYTPSGLPDSTFGQGGQKKIQVALGNDRQDRSYVSALVPQADGKLLVVGAARQADYSGEGVVLRLRADGSLDPSFGSGGIVRLQRSPAAVPSTFLGAAALVGSRLYVSGSVNRGVTSTGLLASILIEPLPDPPTPTPTPVPTPTPTPTPGPGPLAPPAGVGVLTIAAKKATLKGRTASVQVRCSASGPCRGTLSILSRTGVVTGTLKKGQKRAKAFGNAIYSVPAGASASVAVKITKAASRQASKQLKVRFGIAPGAAALAISNGTVAPAPKKKPKKG